MESSTLSGRIEVELSKTINTMLILRVVIVTTLLGAALYVQAFFRLTSDSLYFIIGLTYLLTVFYAVLAVPLGKSRRFVQSQLLIDIVLVSILILVTGANDSAFVILYYLPVVAASVILGRVSSLMVAVLGGAMFTFVSLAANGDLMDLDFLYPYSHPPANSLAYTIILHISALLIVASLSGYLAGMLQRTAANLRQRTADLRNLEMVNESIVRSITSGIITTGMDGRISFANPAAQRLLETSDKDLKGRQIHQLIEFDPNAQEPIFSEDGWSREMFLLRPDGVKIEVAVSRSFLLGEAADQTGKLYLLQDLREIKELRSKLVMKERLVTAGEMSAAIAHEIRNPLGAISGSAQMIRTSPELPEDQRYLMDIIIRESERLSTILNDFLTFARQPVFSPHKTDILKIAKETIDLLANSPLLSEGHRIEFCDNGARHIRGEVDANMLKQLLYNLVNNGVRASPDGGNLKVDLWEEDDHAAIKVMDNGVGVAPDRLEKMFKPFSTGSPGGVGLGLAIVYRIVQEHGGRILVRSLVGKGTSVTIYLPLKRRQRSNFTVTAEIAEP